MKKIVDRMSSAISQLEDVKKDLHDQTNTDSLVEAMRTIHKAAVESLDPDNFEKLCSSFNQLARTRNIDIDKY